jgi:hypothetical protein
MDAETRTQAILDELKPTEQTPATEADLRPSLETLIQVRDSYVMQLKAHQEAMANPYDVAGRENNAREFLNKCIVIDTLNYVLGKIPEPPKKST